MRAKALRRRRRAGGDSPCGEVGAPVDSAGGIGPATHAPSDEQLPTGDAQSTMEVHVEIAADQARFRDSVGPKERERKTTMPRLITAVAVALAILFAGPVRTAHAQRENLDLTAQRVQQSIESGVLFLQRNRMADGTWGLFPQQPGAVTSLCVLALLTAGVPVSDPSIQEPLAYLRTLQPSWVYQASLQTMVFCMAEPEKDLLLIRRNVSFLERNQMREGRANGCWNYAYEPDKNRNMGPGDNSNTQFALLALYEAHRVGIPSDPATWKKARDYWTGCQHNDGSWGYVANESAGTGSMTCAGIASLIMASEVLESGDVTVDGETIKCCEPRAEQKAIEDGLRWLGRPDVFSVERNPNDASHVLYYLYGLERVGRLTNRRLIGKYDWYREGLTHLLQTQAPLRGCWKGLGNGEDNEVIGTCLALIFVSKGRRPVLATKLSFETDHWERHRQDLAHLSDYCAKRWKQEMTWQVVRLRGATGDDFNAAPVLYISGSEKQAFSNDEVKALRQYVDLGGFIFAENCCFGTEFDADFRKLMERVFPERDPSTNRLLHELRELPPEHAVFSAEEPLDLAQLTRPYNKLPLGIDVGCRTSVVYFPANLGCYWELDKTGRTVRYPQAVEDKIRACRSFGINVMAYATNRELKNKLEIPKLLADDRPGDALDRTLLYVAELKHNGGSTVAPNALVNLLRQLRHETGIRVNVEKREMTLTQDAVFDQHLVYMHGRTAFSFSEAERKQLRAFVDRGGLLLADSVCSSPEFTASFRREMQAVFPETPLKGISGKHEMFSEAFGGFNLSTVTLRDPQRAAEGGPVQAQQLRVPPELEGIEIGGRFGVIFSRYDLSCALERQNSLECVGYSRDDAAKIGINVVLFSLKGNL
jgi:hypothetical protein